MVSWLSSIRFFFVMSSKSSTGSYTKGELSLGRWNKGPSQDYSALMDVFKQFSIAQHAAM